LGLTQNILVTGGAGFIGSNLSNKLVLRGHFVRVLDSLAPQIHGDNPALSSLYNSLDSRIEFVHGSVTNSDDMMLALRGIDTVVHLAAETGTGQSMYSIRHYNDVNIAGTALLLDLISNLRYPVKKIVVASSRAIYGEGKYLCSGHGTVYPKERKADALKAGDFEMHCPECDDVLTMQLTDENSMLNPNSIYGITKLSQEQMVLTVGKALGISAIAYRYQNVYGPGQSLHNPYTGILSIFSTRILNGNPVNIFEDGKESRDFVYIDDVVDVTLKGIEFEPEIVTALNVGSGVPTDVLSVANTLKHLLNINVPIEVSGNYRIGDIRHNVADLTRISLMLGYKPSVLFDEGIRKFIHWVQGQKIHQDRYEESIIELRSKGLFK